MTELDARVFHFVHDAFGDGPWLVVMAILSAIGGGWGALFVLPLFFSSRSRRFAISLTGVLAVTAVLVFSLKRTVCRDRPCVALSGVTARVFGTPHDYSFPSGHSAGTFAFTVFIALAIAHSSLPKATRIALVAVLLVLAVGVGISRIVLGVHFPGDVAAGAVLGSAVALIGARIHRKGLTHVGEEA